LLDALRDGLAVVLPDIRRVRVVLLARAWEDPPEVGMREVGDISTRLTLSAIRPVGTEQALSEPEREPLLSHTGGAVQKHAVRQRTASGRGCEPLAEAMVPDEGHDD
jgi:hypothetical protein